MSFQSSAQATHCQSTQCQAIDWASPLKWVLLIWLLTTSFTATAFAQDDPSKFGNLGLPTVGDSPTTQMPDKGGVGNGGLGSGGFGSGGFDAFGAGPGIAGPKVAYSATFEVEKGGQQGKLAVTADVAEGWHTYSVTQPDGGPLATAITLNDVAKVVGPFVPDHDPEIGQDQNWPGVPIEEHHGVVTWHAAIEFPQPIDPETLKLEVTVDGLVCASACEPVVDTVTAKFTGYYGATPKVESIRPEATHAVWSAKITPAVVAPGEQAVLEITAQTDPDYHVYQFIPNDPYELGKFQTWIVAKTKSGLKFATPQADSELEAIAGFEPPVYFHAEPVTWSIPVHVPETAKEGQLPIEMLVGFMTCNDRSCDQPTGVAISGVLTVGSQSSQAATNMTLEVVDYAVVAESPKLASWIDGDADELLAAEGQVPEEPAQALTLVHILAGLVGGFILNFMPCVLPVIGLKVMSFVNQSGNSHARVVSLNLAFVGGILGVMLLLALATVIAKVVWGSAFGWGEQFTVLEFKVVLAALVFAMALSFLGVWEIPIPGFATSSKSGELMEQEGLWGAFLKGVLTTVLATPCSGPLLGSLFGLSLALSSANVILLYTIVGLGMSLPYLALCVSPGLINFLPKPGPWMETLKQALAFPLLFTAVFFVASIGSDYRVATLILLICVWLACWLIGRVPPYEDKGRVRTAWISGAVTIALGAVISFTFFGPIKSDLPWVPYNEAQLTKLRQEGKTVMIDFTANWCLNCQLNMRIAIDKPNVAQLVEKNDVIPMVADWTGRSQEIRDKLAELQSNSIPVLAIYPADPAAEPIILRDILTESQVLEALEQAGPSREATQLTSHVD